MRQFQSVCSIMAVASLWGGISVAQADTATQPATSQPASEIALVRVGPTVITQADFNADSFGRPLQQVQAMKSEFLQGQITRCLFLLYVKDHPDLINETALEHKLDPVYKLEHVKNRAELEAKLKAENRLHKLQDFLDRNRILMGRAALIKRAEDKIKDADYLRKMFDSDPTAFNGTRVKVRHILIAVHSYAKPEERKALRAKAQQLRDDVVSGRRTWEQCIDESDDASTKVIGGDTGYISRHLMRPETFSAAAFALKPGETSDIVETPLGFHVLQVLDISKGDLSFDQAKESVRRWALRKPLYDADVEARAKYKVVVLREPDLPPPPPPRPTRPALSRKHVGGAQPQVGRATNPAGHPAAKAAPRQRQLARPSRTTATRPATNGK